MSEQIFPVPGPRVEDLASTDFLDFDNPELAPFLEKFRSENVDETWLLQTYSKIRDYQLYDPHHLDLRKPALKASSIAFRKRAWCVEKSILLATVLRANNIPCRLGYATVINHLGSDRLELYLRRKEITFHGYVNVFWKGNWSRCTPAFDKRVCRLQNVPVLEWDAKTDSLFQQELAHGKFMEYTHYYGEFSDVPLELMEAEMKRFYPHLFEKPYDEKHFSFFHSESN